MKHVILAILTIVLLSVGYELKCQNINSASKAQTVIRCRQKNCCFDTIHIVKAAIKQREDKNFDITMEVEIKVNSDMIVFSKDFSLQLLVSTQDRKLNVDEFGPPWPMKIIADEKYKFKAGEGQTIPFSAIAHVPSRCINEKFVIKFSIRNTCECSTTVPVTMDFFQVSPQ